MWGEIDVEMLQSELERNRTLLYYFSSRKNIFILGGLSRALFLILWHRIEEFLFQIWGFRVHLAFSCTIRLPIVGRLISLTMHSVLNEIGANQIQSTKHTAISNYVIFEYELTPIHRSIPHHHHIYYHIIHTFNFFVVFVVLSSLKLAFHKSKDNKLCLEFPAEGKMFSETIQ